MIKMQKILAGALLSAATVVGYFSTKYIVEYNIKKRRANNRVMAYGHVVFDENNKIINTRDNIIFGFSKYTKYPNKSYSDVGKYTLNAGSILKMSDCGVEYIEAFIKSGKFNPLYYDTIETNDAYYFYNFNDKIQFDYMHEHVDYGY